MGRDFVLLLYEPQIRFNQQGDPSKTTAVIVVIRLVYLLLCHIVEASQSAQHRRRPCLSFMYLVGTQMFRALKAKLMEIISCCSGRSLQTDTHTWRERKNQPDPDINNMEQIASAPTPLTLISEVH